MTARSTWRGNAIEVLNDVFVYSDTKEPVSETHNDRPCGNCNKAGTAEGHDACLGTLPGVMNACCGHGKESEAYVQFPDGRHLKGTEAIEWVRSTEGKE